MEHYVKIGSKQWMLQEYDGSDAILSFASLGLETSLRDIYNKVQFEPVALDKEAET